jgi:hypothetical protein
MEVVNMARRRAGRKKPSRARYEQAHPTISFRLPLETHGRLLEQMQALGLSAAAWVKVHLDQDDRRANARAELLAGRRDNLRQELERLEQLVERRKRELEAPIGQEKARLRKNLEGWHQEEVRRFLRRKGYNETRLRTLRCEVRQEREQLSEVQAQTHELIERRCSLEREVRKAEAYGEQVMQATAMLKWLLDKWPWIFCESCPASPLNRVLLDIVRGISMSPLQGPLLQSTNEFKPEGVPSSSELLTPEGGQDGAIKPADWSGCDRDEKEVERGDNA